MLVMVMVMLATPMLPTDTTMARGRLRLSPRLRLTILIPMDLDTAMDMPMLATPMLPTDTSMARGRLRLSPRLRLTILTPMVLELMAMLDTMAMLTPATTMARGMLSPRLMLMLT